MPTALPIGDNTILFGTLEIPFLILGIVFAFITANVLKGSMLGRGMTLLAWGFLVMGIGHLHMQVTAISGHNILSALLGAGGGARAWALALMTTWALSGFGFYQIYRAARGTVTDREKAEDELQAAAKFPSENPNPVLRIASNSRLLYANQAASAVLDLFGCRVGQSVTDPWSSLVSECLGTGSNRESEVMCGDRTCSLSFVPVPEAGYVNVYGHDVTEQNRAERALRASEERFRSVTESAIDAIISADGEGIILSWNRGAEAMFGYTQGEVLGKPLTVLMPERYRLPHQQGLERFRTTGEGRVIGKTVELAGLRKDGTEFPLELSLAIWRVGESTFFSGIARDLSERKQLEQQLRQAQKMEAIGQLAGGVAHDFNNLLTVINGYSELLLGTFPPQDPRAKTVQQIKQAGHRAAALTSQLLAFSRKQVLQPTILDLNAVVRNMEPMLRRLIGEDIEFATRLPADLGVVMADASQVEQVLMNLVINARDAMPQGGLLTIETANVHLDQACTARHVGATPGEYVMFAVTDTGIGMDAATQARIFEPFFTTKERGKGTGLGLSTVYGIVKQSGGYIWVYSEPGQGSTFKVYLPQAKETLKAAPVQPALTEAFRGSETVLLVEDEEMVRSFARTVLQTYGYTVLEAQTVTEAVRTCQEYLGPINLLVTDVVMPGLSGRRLADQVAPLRPTMKVLYMSGYTDDGIVHHGVLEPGMAFLQKPFSPVQLVRKVREVLSSPE